MASVTPITSITEQVGESFDSRMLRDRAERLELALHPDLTQDWREPWQVLNDVLHTGLKNGWSNWVSRALAEGADPNARFDAGQTPAMGLAMSTRKSVLGEILLSMLRAGGNPNVLLAMDGTLFIQSCKAGDSASVLLMLQESTMPVDLLFNEPTGRSVAMTAVVELETPVLEAMQDHFERHIWKGGTAPEGEPGFGLQRAHLWLVPQGLSSDGDNALMVAARTHKSLMWLLGHPNLEICKHLECRNKAGKTPLWSALAANNPKSVDLLLMHGARIDEKTMFAFGATLTESGSSGKTEAEAFKILKAHHAARRASAAIDKLLAGRSDVRVQP